ncbi:hypothetical protein B0T25DRAFT_565467 [Lasiosphaeria hispida]|uniref:Uncharacterized protein n=1 Tax=Lasiosphaeria hispida TaxID=260671 RepID=A0AAJ0HSQ8_9PEZI|nr:hypothetical protein B0T25DRAFT_565467 [Lasiosphaeria hispida]
MRIAVSRLRLTSSNLTMGNSEGRVGPSFAVPLLLALLALYTMAQSTQSVTSRRQPEGPQCNAGTAAASKKAPPARLPTAEGDIAGTVDSTEARAKMEILQISAAADPHTPEALRAHWNLTILPTKCHSIPSRPKRHTSGFLVWLPMAATARLRIGPALSLARLLVRVGLPVSRIELIKGGFGLRLGG